MATISGWIDANEPAAFVSDLSVEVTTLARLMGVPVVMTTLPGRRDDRAHRLGYELADALLAPWPYLGTDMTAGLEDFRSKTHFVGGLSRFDGRHDVSRSASTERCVLALNGTGGAELHRPRRTDDWNWVQRDRQHWADDLWPELCRAEVVVSHCGLGAVSDVAAARRPAILLPQARPHDEQYFTARALARHRLALVLPQDPDDDAWPGLLDRAIADFDPDGWTTWSPGDAAERAAEIIMATAASA